MSKTISAIFRSSEDAKNTIMELIGIGTNRENISILMSEETERDWSAPKVSGPPFEGINIEENGQSAADVPPRKSYHAAILPIGAVGVVGGPGLGMMGAGPAVAAIAAPERSGGLGKFLGFTSDTEAERYEAEILGDRIRNGSILIAVHSPDSSRKVRHIFERNLGIIVEVA